MTGRKMLRSRRRHLADPASVLAVAIIFILTVAALGAPRLAPHDPQEINLESLFAGSSWQHLLGTDQVGRDVLSRLMHGARWSLGGALAVTVIVTVVGTAVGAICGFVGGIVDAIVMRVVDGLLAFPSLLLALAVVAAIGPGLGGVLLGLAAVEWVGYARVVRGLVLSLREREYVSAARIAGATDLSVLTRHVLPNILSPVLVLATLEIGQLILALAGLSFLGLGARSPTPEWGVMINEGRAYLFRAPRLMVYPGLAITLTVLAWNLLGDRLRDVLDPRIGPDARESIKQTKMRDG